MIEPEARFEKPQRRNDQSLWLLAVILIFVGLNIYGAVVGDGHVRQSASRQIKASDTDLDDQSVQDLLVADTESKGAFISTLVDGQLKSQSLKEALDAARDLVNDTHNAPFAARRLIILRALDNRDPFSPTRRGGYQPLDAFTVDLPPDTPPSDRATYAGEAQIWRAAFGPGKATAKQVDQVAGRIRRLNAIKWWRYPALFALYTRHGDAAAAKRYASTAATDGMPTLMVAGIMGFFRVATILIGVVLLVALIAAWYRKFQSRGSPSDSAANGRGQFDSVDVNRPATYAGQAAWPEQLPHLSAYGRPGTPAISGMPSAVRGTSEWWKTEPERVSPSERRLTATDLLGVVLFYLIFTQVLASVITGYPGVGSKHLFHFAGLITPHLHNILRMSNASRMLLMVGLECAVYIVGGGVPIVWMFLLAKKRGASVEREIGWPRRFTGTQILYGFGGYCLAMPLMIVVALAAPKVFRHFPSPSNPAIPQIIGANSALSAMLIIGLASFAAPIVEETLFRGALYNGIRMRLGKWPAILLTGFIFGFFHPVGIAEMFPLAVLGGVFAWMAETRKSLAPSMVAHCINNLTSSLLLYSLMQQ